MNPHKGKFNPEFYVEIYELAKAGLNNTKIISHIGITTLTFKRWRRRYPAINVALRKARELANVNGTLTFRDFVYKRLPSHLQELWDRLEQSEKEKNGIKRVEALLRNVGKDARQHLFLFALTAKNFNVSEACRSLNMSRQTFEAWVTKEPDFCEMMDSIHQAKKDFFEGALIKKINQGDSFAIVHANKTVNRDRGYGEKVQVEISGTINHRHAVVPVDELDLPISVRKVIRDSLRAKKLEAIQGTVEGVVLR